MTGHLGRNAVVYGLLGITLGIVIGVNLARFFAGGIETGGPGTLVRITPPRSWVSMIGVPEIILFLVVAFFVGFWVLLIRGLFWGWPWGGKGRSYHGRLEDLPADFDDWHRRAHERMGATSADNPAGRG